jgi:hypothetical protein
MVGVRAVSILANVRPALALFWRQVWRSGRPDTPDHVPDYPLRCQHCDEPIVLAHAADVATWGLLDQTLYADQEGHYACPGFAFPHKPMPSVL